MRPPGGEFVTCIVRFIRCCVHHERDRRLRGAHYKRGSSTCSAHFWRKAHEMKMCQAVRGALPFSLVANLRQLPSERVNGASGDGQGGRSGGASSS